MSPRQILYRRKFKMPFCKIGQFVLAYDTASINYTSIPRAFCALYLSSNDNGTGHWVFRIGTKNAKSTPKCVVKPMTQDIVDDVNTLGIEEGVQDGIHFIDIDGKATVSDLYNADEHDDDSCASDKDYEVSKDQG